MSLPKREHPRLKNFDYSQNGCYHIIICVKDESVRLSTVGRGLASAEATVRLTKYGETFKSELLDLEDRFNCVKIDKYCIMPNHIHILLSIENAETTYDEIIGSVSYYEQVWRYIDENPSKWLITHHKT